MPVAGSGVPRTVTSARNEWAWISSLATPSVVPAAHERLEPERFRHSHILKVQIYLMRCYLMPSVLWVCRLSRHRGWRRQ